MGYREAFTDAMREVAELDQGGCGALGVLDPSPNNLAGIGENRNLFVFATGNCSESGNGSSSLQRESIFDLTEEENIIRDEFSSLVMKKNESLRKQKRLWFSWGDWRAPHVDITFQLIYNYRCKWFGIE